MLAQQVDKGQSLTAEVARLVVPVSNAGKRLAEPGAGFSPRFAATKRNGAVWGCTVFAGLREQKVRELIQMGAKHWMEGNCYGIQEY